MQGGIERALIFSAKINCGKRFIFIFKFYNNMSFKGLLNIFDTRVKTVKN